MASTTVNFNLKTAGYVNYANQTLTFRLLTAGAEASSGDQSYVTLPGIVTATSAANGDGSATLYRNGKSGIESIYEVILPNREKAKFIIPSGSATIELATLLVDHVPSGSNTQQSSVYAEAIKRANHTGTQLLSTISDAGTIASQASNSVNIDGGAIDGTVIGANSAAAGTFAALTSTSINVSDGNITNVGDINCDSISSDVAATGLEIIFDGTDTGYNKIKLTDNLANALDITESANSYLKFTTTNSGEKVVIGKALDISGATTAAAVTGTNVLASAQSGYNTGGTITQGTSITTAVSLDQPSGVITLFANDFGANSDTSFTLNNNFIDINDVVVASFKTGHSQLTLTVTATANNSCTFTLYNPTGSGTGSITAVINFAIIKTSTT